MEYGKVVLVGAGPGDLDLLTLKAKKYIEEADCIVYDRLVNKKMLKMAKPDAEIIYAGKANHHHTLPQDEINEILEKKAKEYKLVVRLKGGDPYVFGRGGEEALYLMERGITVDMVPGISSSVAALASAGIPITHRGLSKGFQVITAHSRKDEPTNIDYSKLTDTDVTYVFLMGLSHVKDISQGLINAGQDEKTPVAVVSKGTTNHQKTVTGTLSDIEEKVLKNNLESPAIIVVGKVVDLADKLNFFEKRPLFGKKIFLPVIEGFEYSLQKVEKSTLNELEKSLEAAGADVVSVKSGQISPIKLDVKFVSDFTENDYIVFTSGNGVKAFFWNLIEINDLDVRSVSKAKFAVIGEKTANALKQFGIKADIISSKQNGSDLAAELVKKAPESAKLHWFCQKNFSKDFENGVRESFALNRYICYENLGENIKISEEIENKVKNCDTAVFTCGTNVDFALKYFKEVLPNEVYSIGPACSRVLQNYGITPIKEAAISSYEGILLCFNVID